MNGPLASNALLRATVYPDAADSGDRVTNAYNRRSERTAMTDQNDTRHRYDYDRLGRLTADRVVELGLNIDETVRRIETSYNVRGLVEKVTSYEAASAGAVVNEVQRAYNDFDQLAIEYQAHGGAVNPSTTPKVQYAYADGSSNTYRSANVRWFAPSNTSLPVRFPNTSYSYAIRFVTVPATFLNTTSVSRLRWSQANP